MKEVKVQILELIVVLITISGLFLWQRSESREDNRRAEDMIQSIHQEIKDFHGRLCSIEERYRSGK